MRLLTVAFLLVAAAFSTSVEAVVPAAAQDQLGTAATSPFAVSTGTFDSRVAFEAIYYAKATYCPADQLTTWNCPACRFNSGMREVTVFTQRETQAYVGYDSRKNHIVVAIRGSSNIQNWLDNLNFELVPYPPCAATNCKVHKGFYEIYKALSTNIIPQVAAALQRHPTAPLFVTGHSLGGALATLTALELTPRVGGRPVYAYNFGEPRVGCPAFAQHALKVLPEKTQYRIVHKADPVPKVPFREFGYLHVPREIFYDNDGNRTWVECRDTATGEDKSCSDRYPFGLAFADHLNYLGVSTKCAVTSTELQLKGLDPNLAALFNSQH